MIMQLINIFATAITTASNIYDNHKQNQFQAKQEQQLDQIHQDIQSKPSQTLKLTPAEDIAK